MLLSANVRSHTIEFFYSLLESTMSQPALHALRDYLIAEEVTKRGSSKIDLEMMQRFDIPVQTSSGDCGVFLCQYARCIAAAVPFDFDQRSIFTLRRRMVRHLIDQKIGASHDWVKEHAKKEKEDELLTLEVDLLSLKLFGPVIERFDD